MPIEEQVEANIREISSSPTVEEIGPTEPSQAGQSLYAQAEKHPSVLKGTVDINNVFYVTTKGREGPIDKISNSRDDFGECISIDPDRINAIRFGIDPNDGNKRVFEARYSNQMHNSDGGWYPVDNIQDLCQIAHFY